MDCLFCKVVSGDIQADIVYQDDNVVAFHDINPQAPEHMLVIPRKHIATLNDLQASDALLIGQMVQAATDIAKEKKIEKEGFRLVMNCNQGAGQSVFHIHIHLLGGRRLTWPPG